MLKLVLRERLDRERSASHVVVVSATDGGSPSRTGTMSVVVDVLDANDNRPEFSQQTYEVSVTSSITVTSSHRRRRLGAYLLCVSLEQHSFRDDAMIWTLLRRRHSDTAFTSLTLLNLSFIIIRTIVYIFKNVTFVVYAIVDQPTI